MKTYLIALFSLVVGIMAVPSAQADTYNDGWTFYGSNNYRGSKKMMKSGEYDRCSSWRYYSWKAEAYCCVTLYFYRKNGRKDERKLCGNVRDLKAEMRKWGDLKYGWNQPWKNVYRAVFICEGGEQAQDNHRNNGNRNGGWKDHYNKGKCVVWKGGNYGNDWSYYSVGKKYYTRDLKWKFWSLRIPRNYEFYCYVKDRFGKEKGHTLRGDITSLRDHFKKWNVKDYNRGWDYVKYFEIRRTGSGGNGQQANRNNNGHNNNRGGGAWKEHFDKGRCVVWKSGNYGNDWYYYSVGKKYYTRDLKWKFWSLRIPRNYEFYCYVKDRFGKEKGHTLRGDIASLKDHFKKWNVKDYNRGWDYVKYFEIRRAGSGGNANNNMDYTRTEWYKKFGRGGYIVFFQYKDYDGRYYGKPAGDYDPKRLIYPRSIYMKGTSKYLVLEYYDRQNRKKSHVIKKSVKDLGQYLYKLGVHNKYKKEPHKAIVRLAVMNQ